MSGRNKLDFKAEANATRFISVYLSFREAPAAFDAVISVYIYTDTDVGRAH